MVRPEAIWQQRFRGSFTEALELYNFPFDVQNLSITIRNNSNADSRLFAQMPVKNTGSAAAHIELLPWAFVKPTATLSEWNIHRPHVYIPGGAG